MALLLLSSDINLQDDETDDDNDIFGSLHAQMEELEGEKESGEGGWRCICHKIQCAVLEGVKKSTDQVRV